MNTFYAPDRKAWREWLRENHDKEKEVWVVYYRKSTGKPTISYNDAVEEALCFGWIDSIEKGIDSERFVGRFTPRKPKSNWSPSNRTRARRLIASNLMTPSGLQVLPNDL